MAKEVRYPTQEWIDKWIDRWLDANPNTAVSDFSELEEEARDAWWDQEVEAGRPTPYDLTAEQEKASKDARRTPGGQGKERTPVKRERKPNEVKRWIMSVVKVLFEGFELKGNVAEVNLSNVERSLDFTVDGRRFTLTLTEHRAPKE